MDVTTTPELITPRRKIIVKFIAENGKVFTHFYQESCTIKDIKCVLQEVFGVPKDTLDIKLGPESLQDQQKLNEFESGEFGTIELQLNSRDPKYPIHTEEWGEDLQIPDVITVLCENQDEGYREVVVEIADRKIEKPFIGGYIDKNSHIEYLHGYSQTGPPKPKVPVERQSCRETQTYFWRNRKLDTEYEHATQMTTNATWIPNVTDKILVAGPYETAEEMFKRLDIEGKVRTIQRYYWVWKMKKALKMLSSKYRKMMETQRELEEIYEKEALKQKMEEIVHKIFPYTKADFAMVYAMIDRWKRAESLRISEEYCGPARVTEYYVLIEKEIEMLQAVEAHKQKVLKDIRVQKQCKELKAMGEPIVWDSYKHLRVEMHTLDTQKGSDFHKLCASICTKGLDKEGFLEALLNVKLYLHGHNCKTFSELTSLIDRACELTIRGVGNKYLDVLHKRIQKLLMYHTQLPECNDNITEHLRCREEIMLENNLYYCHPCQKLKPGNMFNIDCQLKRLKVCTSCMKNDKTVEPWMNLSPYRFMLHTIRKEERLKGSEASYIFILQEKDMYYLVVNIWHSHSALSENNDVYNLHLCRWFRDVDWSPWNCILLTRDEAKEHLKIKKLDEVYDPLFLNNIYNKQIQAKKHFSLLITLNQEYQEIGMCDTKWNEIRDHKEYVPINKKCPFIKHPL